VLGKVKAKQLIRQMFELDNLPHLNNLRFLLQA
jgi:hypothetical protein